MAWTFYPSSSNDITLKYAKRAPQIETDTPTSITQQTSPVNLNPTLDQSALAHKRQLILKEEVDNNLTDEESKSVELNDEEAQSLLRTSFSPNNSNLSNAPNKTGEDSQNLPSDEEETKEDEMNTQLTSSSASEADKQLPVGMQQDEVGPSMIVEQKSPESALLQNEQSIDTTPTAANSTVDNTDNNNASEVGTRDDEPLNDDSSVVSLKVDTALRETKSTKHNLATLGKQAIMDEVASNNNNSSSETEFHADVTLEPVKRTDERRFTINQSSVSNSTKAAYENYVFRPQKTLSSDELQHQREHSGMMANLVNQIHTVQKNKSKNGPWYSKIFPKRKKKN